MFDNNRLKNRRLDMGLTLEEVGNVVGITRSAVQKHEKGIIKNVYTSTVELFAKALRCSPAYLMSWTDDPSIDISTTNNDLTQKEKRLITAYRNKPNMQASIDKLLDIECGGSISDDITAALEEKGISIKSK